MNGLSGPEQSVLYKESKGEKTLQWNFIWTLKQLNLSLEQYGRRLMKDMDLSPTQGMVLHYLLTHKEQSVYAVDLHTILGISKSSISSTLKMLRKKGYLKMEENPSDDRKKKIVLTSKAYHVENIINANLQRQQRRLYREISDQHVRWLEEDLNTMLYNIKQETRLEENL